MSTQFGLGARALLLHRTALTALVLLTCATAQAFKPTTHVALAEVALEEALASGKVTVYRVDGATIGAKVGDYSVEPELLAALRSHGDQYRAGVLGPDAYPDIMTGQQVIHPDSTETGGSNTWLTHLWTAGQATAATPAALKNLFGKVLGDQAPSRPATLAFVAGYLTHAAGDMFAHTYVNHFAGGDFELGNNAIKHLVFEGYLAKTGPKPKGEVSIAGVQNFIYDTLVNAKPGSALRTLFDKTHEGASFSVPHIFSKLRAELQSDIDAWNQRSKADRVTSPAQAAVITYKEAWVQDIEAGLVTWPETSHRLAVALMYQKSGKADLDAAKALASTYLTGHVLSMLGAPDAVGKVIDLAAVVADVLGRAVPQVVRDAIEDLKKGLLDFLLMRAFGKTSDELKAWIDNPENYFDKVMALQSKAAAERITLKDMREKELKLLDGKTEWAPRDVPAAWNAVTLSKLVLLPPSEINRLIKDLGGTGTLGAANVMLGFNRKLDGSAQWKANADGPGRLVFVEAGVYDKLFLPVKGEDRPAQKSAPADPHYVLGSEYFVADQAYDGSRITVYLSQKLPLAGATGGTRKFFKVGSGEALESGVFYRTRPAVLANQQLGNTVVFAEIEDAGGGGVRRPPRDREEARTATWMIARITDVSDGPKGYVVAGDAKVAIRSLRAVVVAKVGEACDEDHPCETGSCIPTGTLAQLKLKCVVPPAPRTAKAGEACDVNTTCEESSCLPDGISTFKCAVSETPPERKTAKLNEACDVNTSCEEGTCLFAGVGTFKCTGARPAVTVNTPGRAPEKAPDKTTAKVGEPCDANTTCEQGTCLPDTFANLKCTVPAAAPPATAEKLGRGLPCKAAAECASGTCTSKGLVSMCE